jgi:CDP-diacylglycerol pyrophosphatase
MSRWHRDHPFSARTIVALFGVVLAACASLAASGDRDALWKTVHDQCVPDEQANDNPAPCARVELRGGVDRGYVIFKDRVGATQFLLVPTRKISGIDSPDLLLPNSPNYWAAAWQNRTYVSAAAKHDLAWDMVGLAINSVLSRSQGQLHIHMDCLQPDVRAALAAHMGEIGRTWAKLPFDLRGARYFARRLADLAIHDPFKLLASGMESAAQNMGLETLVVVGVMFAPGQNGFVLLASQADPALGNLAHGVSLLDHSCALATAK